MATAIIKKSERALYYYAICFIIGYSFSKFIRKLLKIVDLFHSSRNCASPPVYRKSVPQTLPYYSLTNRSVAVASDLDGLAWLKFVWIAEK